MGQDKEQLKQLLRFVSELYNNPDNKEFAAGIDLIVLNSFTIKTSKDIETIREVLEIKADPSIDYSFIEDPFIQNQLKIDNLRMENALLDLSVKEEIDRYNKFCVNGFLQVENLINYYFHKKYNGNIESILSDIEANTVEGRFPFKRDQQKTITDINIFNKLSAFCHKHFPFDKEHTDYTYKNLNDMRKIRNDSFHRAGEKLKNTSKDESTKYNKPDTYRNALKRLAEKVKEELKH